MMDIRLLYFTATSPKHPSEGEALPALVLKAPVEPAPPAPEEPLRPAGGYRSVLRRGLRVDDDDAS